VSKPEVYAIIAEGEFLSVLEGVENFYFFFDVRLRPVKGDFGILECAFLA
jgi:hypothetical protein